MNKNLEIFKRRENLYNQIKTPRLGDYVIHTNGNIDRITHVWNDGYQTGGSQNNAYYLGNSYMEYSGSLDHSIDKNLFELTNYQLSGKVWFFKDNEAKAHNGIYFDMMFRVYKIKGEKTNYIDKWEALSIKDNEYYISNIISTKLKTRSRLDVKHYLKINKLKIKHRTFKNSFLLVHEIENYRSPLFKELKGVQL